MFYTKIINLLGEVQGQSKWPVSKVVCVGRNYAAHAKELNNPIPKTPLLFIKSTNCLADLDDEICIPKNLGECQHELEIAVLIGNKLTHSGIQESIQAIKGIGLGLDLTLRELQLELKSKGQPWEKAKSFDGACPVTGFIPIDCFSNLSSIEFSLINNGRIVQHGNSEQMLFDIPRLIQTISENFTLYPGDIILTGTPEGVASLNTGDKISLKIAQQQVAQACII